MQNEIISLNKNIKPNEIVKDVNEDIKIIRESKKCLDYRTGIIGQDTCPKYFFTDKNGKKISSGYNSIKPLSDGIHYIVSELDFMYTLDLEDFRINKMAELSTSDIEYFKFHFGVVNVLNNEVNEVVPIIYKKIIESNEKTIIVYSDEKYDHFKDYTINQKLGCINLDVESEFYGWNITPVVFDFLEHFNLEFKGYAHARFEDVEGYLYKDIDIDRYKDYIDLFYKLKNDQINYSEYKNKLKNVVSKMLISKQEIESKLSINKQDSESKINTNNQTTDKEYQEESIILYHSPKYFLIAEDKIESSSNIRTLIYRVNNKSIKIGSYNMNNVEGEQEWCIFNDNFIAILSKNNQKNVNTTINTLFDIKTEQFVINYEEYLSQLNLNNKLDTDIKKFIKK